MDKKLFINYVYNILFQVTKFALTFFLVPYTMEHLGESVLGISDYASSICGWFVLFGVLGVSTYGIREIGKVRDDKEELSRNFFEILTVQLHNVIIALILFVLYIELFVSENKIIYYLYCFNLIGFGIDITWFYYGVEDFKLVSIRNTLVKIASVILTILLVKTPSDLWKFVLINTSTNFLSQVLTYLGVRKYVNYTKVKINEAYKHHLLPTFLLFIPTIAADVYTLLNQTMLGTMIEDKGSVALFKTSQSFITMFLYFITSIGAVVMPRIANVYAKDEGSKEVNKYINSTFNFAMILSIPMMFAMAAVSPNFFPWYLPNQADVMIRLVQVTCSVIVLISITDVFGTQYLVPTGRTKELTISVVLGFVVNVILNILLIPRLQAIGASIGNVGAELTIVLVQWWFVRNDIHLHSMNTFVKSLISSLVMAIVVYVFGIILPSSVMSNGIQAIFGVITYLALMILLKEETIIRIIKTNSVKIKNIITLLIF